MGFWQQIIKCQWRVVTDVKIISSESIRTGDEYLIRKDIAEGFENAFERAKVQYQEDFISIYQEGPLSGTNARLIVDRIPFAGKMENRANVYNDGSVSCPIISVSEQGESAQIDLKEGITILLKLRQS